jgi:glycosyltransferase involved in cell wall biosynthesis
MRVCLVTAEYPPQQGGVGDYTRELAAALRRQGADAFVVTGGAPVAGDAAGPVPVERCIRGWGWRAWWDLDRALRRLAPQVANVQYQAAAYGQHPAINLWPRRAGRRWPIVVTFHDLRVPYLFPKAGRLRFRAVLEMARSARRAIVTNIEDQAVLAPLLAQPPALIPIGSNIHPAPPPGFDREGWRRKAGAAEGETVLAYFGFLNESKGGEELVRTLAGLRQRGLAVSLWMIGGQVGASDPTNQAYLARVRQLIGELGVEPWVRWTGFVSPAEVSAYLLSADLCVLPYRDGVSFRRGSLMAALAHGLPVVSTVPRLLPPEIQDGQNMALVPPGDAEALAGRIAALIGDPAARARLGEGARGLARRFEWDGIARRTLEVYDALV